jgi:hypothetical protein
VWDNGTKTNKLFKIWLNLHHVRNKRGKIIETNLKVKVKFFNASINMGDIHVTTQSKANEEHVFKN